MSFPHLCVGIPCIICHPRFGVRDVETVMGDPRDAEIARLRAEVAELRAADEDRRIGSALRALVARGETAGATLWHGRYVVRVGDISEASHAPTLVEAMEKAVRRD